MRISARLATRISAMRAKSSEFSDYALCLDLTETAVQDAISTESYGNFGLAEGAKFSA